MKNLQDDMPVFEKKLLEKEGLTDVIEKLDSPQNYRGTETSEGIHKIASFDEVSRLVEEYIPNTKTALQIMLAVATSGMRSNRVMLWMLLVGNPSSGKTDILKFIQNNEKVMALDSLTQNSFISGERPTKNQKVFDLLSQLDKMCLTIKDWTVIFSLNEDMTKKLLGDLVGIYDKSYSKHSSRRGMISYQAEFSHIGCITPATLNRHQTYLNMIGPRFLSYQVPELTTEQEDSSFKAVFNSSDDDRLLKEKVAGQAVNEYFTYLNSKELIIGPLTNDQQEFLKTASKFMARARGIVIIQTCSFTNDENQLCTYYEPLDIQVEQPWRGLQQLIILSKYLAFVAGKSVITDSEMRIIIDVVLSSMPADRARAIQVMLHSDNQQITAKQLSDGSDRSVKTARRQLEELAMLKIVKKTEGTGQMANLYAITDEFKDWFNVYTGEFVSYKVQSNSLGEEKQIQISVVEKENI